jgi:DNA-binding PadR family transcriptional regulator
MSGLRNSALDIEIERYVRRYRRGVVNSLLEFLILNYLEKGKLCGYDIITLLHERFHILLSPGQVYPVIDLMAEQGLLRKERQGRAVLLEASLLGVSLLKACREDFRAIQMQLSNPMAVELRAVAQ